MPIGATTRLAADKRRPTSLQCVRVIGPDGRRKIGGFAFDGVTGGADTGDIERGGNRRGEVGWYAGDVAVVAERRFAPCREYIYILDAALANGGQIFVDRDERCRRRITLSEFQKISLCEIHGAGVEVSARQIHARTGILRLHLQDAFERGDGFVYFAAVECCHTEQIIKLDTARKLILLGDENDVRLFRIVRG